MIPKQTILELVNSARIPTGAKRIITEDVEALADSPVHIVNNCSDCPISGYDERDDDYVCFHPKSSNIYGSETAIFATCPLKQHSLTIQLSQ
jgi:hypothetical protein